MTKTYKAGDTVPCSNCGEPLTVGKEGNFLTAYHTCTKHGRQQMFRAPVGSESEPVSTAKLGRPEEGAK